MVGCQLSYLKTPASAVKVADQAFVSECKCYSGSCRLYCVAVSYGGRGPPEASCSHVVSCMQDTFLDLDHLKESFPGHEFEVVNKSGQDTHYRPFRVTFPPPAKQAVPTRKVRSSCSARSLCMAGQQGLQALIYGYDLVSVWRSLSANSRDRQTLGAFCLLCQKPVSVNL